MVNREKYHGLEFNLDKLINSTPSEVKEMGLKNIGDFLKKHAYSVYAEMKENMLYEKWLEVNVGYIYLLTFNNKPVGFVGYGAGRDIKALVLSHVYLLKKYRGKGLFIEHLHDVNKFRFNKSNFILQIQHPNRFLINSLLKAKFITPINEYGLCFGLLSFFNIQFARLEGDLQIGAMTPFYDLNLFSPVGVYEDKVILDDLCDTDVVYFNALPVREYHSNNESYMNGLKEWINTLMNELGSIALKEVGDCEGMFDRISDNKISFPKVMIDGVE